MQPLRYIELEEAARAVCPRCAKGDDVENGEHQEDERASPHGWSPCPADPLYEIDYRILCDDYLVAALDLADHLLSSPDLVEYCLEHWPSSTRVLTLLAALRAAKEK